MKKLSVPAFLLLFLMFFHACKTTHPIETMNKAEKEGKKLTQEQQIQNTALFIDGVREKELGNPDKAMGLFAQCYFKFV